ncbi:MAG: nucleotide exchange factor GrpE [Anaerolineae bacterium]|nr:nucleotide exchange factor GrpE [Anaerolineae bacterium]
MTEEVHEENAPELEESETLETVIEEPETPPSAEAPSAGAPSEEVTLEEKLQQLEAQLAEAEQKAAEYLDGLQRSQASFANYRKRNESEQVSWRSVANAALLSRLLPVLDDFERAFQALPKEFEGNPWLSGITLIQRKVAGILEAENVKPIELEPGDVFDPLYHQAVLYQEVPGFEDGQIVAEVERGYILGERVLRPSSVVVAKVPPRAPEPEPEPEEEGVDAEVIEDESACCNDESAECLIPETEQEDDCCCGDDESCNCQDPA